VVKKKPAGIRERQVGVVGRKNSREGEGQKKKRQGRKRERCCKGGFDRGKTPKRLCIRDGAKKTLRKKDR